MSPDVRERAYREVVASSKERVVKGWELRMLHQGRWSLHKLTNPIDDPQQYKKGYPATDDPTAEAGPVPEVQIISPEKSKSAPPTSVPKDVAGTQPTLEPSKTMAEMASEEVEAFLSGIGKDLFPDPTQRTGSPAKSSSGSDKTQSSREDWPPETAKEKHDRLVRETEQMQKKQQQELEKQMKKSAKTPARGSTKSPRPGTSKQAPEAMDTGEGTSREKEGSKKGSKGERKSRSKKPAQTPLTGDDPEIPKKILDLCRTKVPT